MKRQTKRPLRSSTRKTCMVSVPIDELLEEALMKIPRPLKIAGRKKGQNAYVTLAVIEGLLALSEYFERIEEKRNVWRSDLVFRFQVVPGVKGRAAEAEEESRAIDHVLQAAVKSAGV